MGTLREERAAALQVAQDLIDKTKTEERDLTEDEQSQVQAKFGEVEELDKKIESASKSSALVAKLASFPSGAPEEENAGFSREKARTVGQRFIKSDAYRAFKANHPSGVGSGTPVHIEAKGLGSLHDLGIGTKKDAETIDSGTGQIPTERYPDGYANNLTPDRPTTFLDLVTTGNTDASYIEYAQIVDETNGAAIVAEGDLKPLSDVSTDKDEAKAYTYADGFDITNQTLADDGALATFMETRIRQHLSNLIEDKLLNGSGSGTEPKGILKTSGLQSQDFDHDVITSLAGALQKLADVQVSPQAIVMNPADVWAMRLLKEDGVGYMLGNPLQQGLDPTPFGVKLVSSNRVTKGKALVGDFSSVQFLQREPISVLAFNQHKDYAQRNMSYVRAELRALQFVYAPREIVDTDISEPSED